jgi:hypothetical protein
MILSFPIDAWILLLVAVGVGLGLEVAFYRARRHDRRVREAARVVDEAGSSGAGRAAGGDDA